MGGPLLCFPTKSRSNADGRREPLTSPPNSHAMSKSRGGHTYQNFTGPGPLRPHPPIHSFLPSFLPRPTNDATPRLHRPPHIPPLYRHTPASVHQHLRRPQLLVQTSLVAVGGEPTISGARGNEGERGGTRRGRTVS